LKNFPRSFFLRKIDLTSVPTRPRTYPAMRFCNRIWKCFVQIPRYVTFVYGFMP
jgi:hypothetical protein